MIDKYQHQQPATLQSGGERKKVEKDEVNYSSDQPIPDQSCFISHISPAYEKTDFGNVR